MAETRFETPEMDTYDDEGIVKDEDYVRLVEHGDDPFDPHKIDPDSAREADTVTRTEPYDLRPSSLATENKGIYTEDESELTGNREEILGLEKDKDLSREVETLVAASHRKGRSPEGKKKSAEKASMLYEKVAGVPLEIGEGGEVVTEK